VNAIAQYCRLALDRRVATRALLVALVVGSILIAINQGDVLLSGQVTSTTLWKLILTPLVPYLVSTHSSVAALRQLQHPASR